MLAFQHFHESVAQAWTAFFAILGLGLLVVATDILVRDKQITTISAIYFGMLLGLLLGNILSTAIEPFLFDWDTSRDGGIGAIHVSLEQEGKAGLRILPASARVNPHARSQSEKKALLSLLITVFCCYVSISTLLQTKDEFRFIIPYVEFSKQVKGAKPLLLDTSVIIDGRIADICNTKLLDTKLIVPRFVLQELQSVADSSDKLKRNRGRRGLDILKRMQGSNKVELVLHDANLPELRDVDKVDERLVLLAKALGARVVTNDYNLNKIAELQGVEVINLNELANALKPAALPGEMMSVKVVKAGDQIGQGVGYLEDGTMVVVEHGRSHIGQEVHITVTSVLQTPAGRMIFGRIESRPGAPATPAPAV
ncbi:MAG: TRAM domain-containing protein [Gemmataceae bacterium]|nr:TRAM domain-containing protein [Gemmataceae bacterium]